jgi:hypothetical protein
MISRVVQGIANGRVAASRRYWMLANQPRPFQTPAAGAEIAQRIASATTADRDGQPGLAPSVWVGIVRTVDDFGHVGDLPSHPEMLDYLAAEFVEDGWSVKRLIRRLVLSRTFQLADAPSADSKKRSAEPAVVALSRAANGGGRFATPWPRPDGSTQNSSA